MSEATQSPVEHYAEAESILQSLPSLGLDRDDLIVEAITALTHAVLALVEPGEVE